MPGNESGRKLTRRAFIPRVGAFFTGASLISACSVEPSPTLIPPVRKEPRPTPTDIIPAITPQPDLLRLHTEGALFTEEIVQAAQGFMGIEAQPKGIRHERTEREENLFRSLETRVASAADIILALQAAATIEGRGWGMQLLWQKRQAGELSTFGINPLDQNRIKWATDNEIDPRMLAIARDSIYPALELLKAAPDLFFEAVPGNQRGSIRYEDTLPNPGVVAKLNMTETGSENLNNPDPLNQYWGYVFIGGSTAWNELNLDPAWFPYGKEHLKAIADILQNQTGLPYLDNVETIPGSERGNPVFNGSGGAIGPQFMPINALLFMDWYNTANERLGSKYPPANPFDPFTGTVMCYLYLASEWYGRHGDVTDKLQIVRPGYRASKTDDAKINTLQKWNPTHQARLALDAGYDYFSRIGRI